MVLPGSIVCPTLVLPDVSLVDEVGSQDPVKVTSAVQDAGDFDAVGDGSVEDDVGLEPRRERREPKTGQGGVLGVEAGPQTGHVRQSLKSRLGGGEEAFRGSGAGLAGEMAV